MSKSSLIQSDVQEVQSLHGAIMPIRTIGVPKLKKNKFLCFPLHSETVLPRREPLYFVDSAYGVIKETEFVKSEHSQNVVNLYECRPYSCIAPLTDGTNAHNYVNCAVKTECLFLYIRSGGMCMLFLI